MESYKYKYLLEPKVRIPKMKPPPDLHMFDKLPIKLRPLYNRKAEQDKKIKQFLMEKANRAKRATDLVPIQYLDIEYRTITKKKHLDDVRQCAMEMVPTPMLIAWEKRIIRYIPKPIQKRFPKAFAEFLQEIKDEWNICLHSLVVKTIVKEEPGVPRIRYQERPYKCGGKTPLYEKFLRSKKLLGEKLLIVHPFMCLIKRSSELVFPIYILNFEKYRTKDAITIKDLRIKILDDISKVESMITTVWYPRLITWLQVPRRLNTLSIKKKGNLLRCASKFLSMQITELMRRSTEYVIAIMGDDEKVPVINMELKFETDIVLYPNFEEIFLVFHEIIDKIADIAQKLLPLEGWINVSCPYSFIPVSLNDWIQKNSHERLNFNLEKVYGPVKFYIHNLMLQYSMLLNGSVGSDGSFKEKCKQIECFQNISEDLTATIENEYFSVGTIYQGHMIIGLKNNAIKLKNEILDELCLSHQEENKSICVAFQEIADRVQAVCKDATELMESGAYCKNAKNVLLVELEERIVKSLSVMGQLIEMTTLTLEHIELNTRTVNWLSDMIPILAQVTSNYENIKYDMEEDLLTKTNDLTVDIEKMIPYISTLDEMDDIENTHVYLQEIRRLIFMLDECEVQLLLINREETVFKFPLTQYPDFEELKDYILPFYELMYLLHKWRRSFFTWMDGPFEYIENVQVERQHTEYHNGFNKIFKDYKNKIKQQISDGNERRFKGLVEDPDPMNLPAPMKLCAQAIKEISDWLPHVQLVNIMCNPALRQRHWDEISAIAGFDITPDAGTTIRKLISLDIWSDMSKYEIISIGACKELALITGLHAMMASWNYILFKMTKHKDTDINILIQLDDIQASLDDSLTRTISMRGSAFVKPFETEVKNWYEKLKRINLSIDEWGRVQSQWLYLLPIFSSDDIIAQMPTESIMFQDVNTTYKKYMQLVEKDPRVIEISGGFDLLESMKLASALLEKINNGVSKYLDEKRLYFNRFFFLSNEEMLEILSETTNPLKVQPHLKKCFEGISKLHFDADLNILGMISKENEKINFSTTISTKETRGSVEKWLLLVEEQMTHAVLRDINLAYDEYPKLLREDWVPAWAGMVVLCVSQIYWALDVHSCLKSQKLQELKAFHVLLSEQLAKIVSLMRSSRLNNITRISIKALIVIDIHAKDVVQELIDKNVKDETDFHWLAQLRYYWEENAVQVKIINAVIKYAYEYLGNTDRLVVTPLTDRCYRTLIGAYYLHLNGAPEGPAGTGKTETTKDLAKALAIQCIVFNCSDSLDYKGMGKFFKGLATCGAWACFDEFNRIDVEVLSVVAQQLLSIIQAAQQKMESFIFEGTQISFNPACFFCITMNPGYAGRSELPDNLKVLFRTVAMMVPNYSMIGEISLYSYGFKDAKNLSMKIVTTYRLCSEQLSSQYHYDYGMRAVKTVLLTCGYNKMKFPGEDEDVILLRSLKDVNLPKFLSYDLLLFEGILSDIFPNITLSTSDYTKLTEISQTVCENQYLDLTPSFLTKIIQTYEMMIVRHGFMLVGDPYSGKTSTLNVLAEALAMVDDNNIDNVQRTVINPKSVHINQLYGYFDPKSYEWIDGIVVTIFRNYAKDESTDRKWIIFDGPIDSIWIENMNTVLDDNRKLCLTSGEVIAMTDKMSMIFEIMDLTQASPATISRCGMIYMDASIVGHKPFVNAWVRQCNPRWREGFEKLLIDLCDWIFPYMLGIVQKKCYQLVTGGGLNLINCTLQIVKMLMSDAIEAEDDTKYLKIWIQASFMFATYWGIGGLLDTKSRELFDRSFRDFWRGEQGIPESLEKVDVSIPYDGTLYDYVYQYKQKGSWKNWQDVVKNVKIIETNNLQQTVIPTVDTGKCMFILDLHIRHKKPMLFIGPTGTGKSFYVQDYMMNQLSVDKYMPLFITFSTTTSANQTQELVLSKLNKLKNKCYGPPDGSLAVIFIDDMNMPAKETYGAQPAIEILRQYFDHGHWYNLLNSDKIFITDVLFLAAISPVGGCKQLLYPRFLRHFNMFAVNEFSEDSVTKIFSNILQIGMRRNGFGNDVSNFILATVAATIEIYQSAMKDLRPTPDKSHYLFNLRDCQRVIQGCSLIKKDSVDNKRILNRLWTHEVLRVYYDRLIDDNDKNWLFLKLQQCTIDYFKETLEEIFEDYLDGEDEDEQITEAILKNLMFGTFLDTTSPEDDKKYEEILNVELFHEKALEALEEYNAINNRSKVNIVLFKYALEHLSKICRIFSMAGGSILLVGVGGSGRQSLTKLASVMTGKMIFQPEITKSYDMADWKEDLKKLLRQSGGLARETTFLFNEGQIKKEIFIENIDSFLNSGEVPNLYELDEKQEILDLVRLDTQGGNRNLDVSALQVFNFFIARCRAKLHVSLCFSPVGSSFRNRLRLYPSLVNCCTIDWFESWPEDALDKVACHYMSDINLPEDIKNASIEVCKYFHLDACRISEEFLKKYLKKTYVTTASYLDLIRSFTCLTNNRQKELQSAKQRYMNGLNKLNLAADAVSNMQRDLSELKPQLITMADKGREMMEEIERETIEADNASVQVRMDEKLANEQAAAAQVLKKDCEADLALAIPILEDAIAALNTLKPTDITLVKSMKNPPAAIKLVMAAVCVMKNIPPDKIPDPANPGQRMFDFWGPSKRLLGDMAFLQTLKEYDKDNIPAASIQKIRKEYLPHKDFKPHIIAKASTAAEGLCKWVIAMDMYDAVAKVVAPKKAKLQAAEMEFAATMANLEEKKAMVALLEKKLADLNAALREANIKKKLLEKEVEICIYKLGRAEKLISSLAGERSRWTSAAEKLQLLYDNLAGDIILSCGIIAYLSSFTSLVRSTAILHWQTIIVDRNIPFSENYALCKVLGSDFKIQSWYLAGLPKDEVSTDNAIIQDKSIRWSILIDPQGQANKWIRNMEKVNGLSVIKLTDPDYMKVLEISLENGTPVLIENILEELEAPLDPILMKNIFIENDKECIALGETVIEYCANFRLYMTTKLRNPHFLPEVFNKVTLINFSLTIDGLEDQLLGIVVAKERPDLETKREKLIVDSANNATDLKNVEDNILKTLEESKGDILEDEAAIGVLYSSKILSTEILKRQDVTRITQMEIEEFRLSYKSIATHAAVLYYCITDLPNVDPMYQYSLIWFISLYISSMYTAKKSNILEKRLKFLRDAFTYDLYSNVCRSLFEKDKLMFSFILSSKIMMASGEIDEEEFDFLLTGGTVVNNTEVNPASWLTEKSWGEICKISELPFFESFKSSFANDTTSWKKIFDSVHPHNEIFPKPWDTTTDFQKLLILRILRPEKLVEAITIFIREKMGEKFVTPPPFDIYKSYKESNCLIPLIFILSPGADPMGALWKFSEKMGFSRKFSSISLGQGQGDIARALIEQAQTEGNWVCLQNCHLSVSWLPTLESICEKLDLENCSLNFRLWLTSYPSNKFPQSILQEGIKITNEPPIGLQSNLYRSYMTEPLKEMPFYEGCPGKDKVFSKLLYTISFFHAVVKERKKYGPLGWNIPYGFDESDFQISVMQLQMFLNQYDDIPYAAVSYLTGECNYGGRVTDDWDRRLITTILKDYINEEAVINPQYSCSPVGTEYSLPKRCEYLDYVKHIGTVPTLSTPEVFGLHMNAGISRDYTASMNLTDTLSLLSKGYIAGISKAESDVSLANFCSDIMNKMPSQYDINRAKAKYPIVYTESMNTVLIQEMERFNRLLNEITSSLYNLQKAIIGIIAMSPQLETQANTILLGKIPINWMKVSYPSLKPLSSYILDLIERLRVLQLWYDEGKPVSFWLPGFFFTQAFLTGAMQNYARQHQIPIDKLVFDCEILRFNKSLEAIEKGVYINGIFIEGARWNCDTCVLDEQKPRVLNELMPTIWLFPVIKDNFDEGTNYRCPIYRTVERRGILATTGHSSNFVISIMIPSNKPPAHWIKRSAAMILQLND